MKKRLLAILLILVLAGAVYYMTPKYFGRGVEPASVDHIQVFDGNTGNGFTVDDPEDIEYIVNNVKSQKMKRDGISIGHMGYLFQVSYVDSKDKDIIPLFIINGDNTVRKDPFFYRCDGGLCVDYLKKIENGER